MGNYQTHVANANNCVIYVRLTSDIAKKEIEKNFGLEVGLKMPVPKIPLTAELTAKGSIKIIEEICQKNGFTAINHNQVSCFQLDGSKTVFLTAFRYSPNGDGIQSNEFGDMSYLTKIKVICVSYM